MPRTPTGKPRGRPLGSGTLGEEGTGHIRLTVRIPRTLYERIEDFAGGSTFTRSTPQLAGCVREALEHYLACPNRRQTKNIPPIVGSDAGRTDTNRQTRSALSRQTKKSLQGQDAILGEPKDEKPQTENVPVIAKHNNWQTENSTDAQGGEEKLGDNIRQTENSTKVVPVPPFDTTKYALGKLCPRGHDYHGTGKTLLRLPKYVCLQCDAERARERRKAKRQAQPA